MTMLRKLAVLAIVAVTFGAAAACGSSGTDTATSTTTEAPASTTTTDKDDDDTTTTTEDEDDDKKKSRTKVTKPAKVEKIDPADLPEDVPTLSGLDITADEEDCVYTVLLDYSSDSSNPTDDATMAGVMGGAMAACIDQDKIAAIITDSVAEEAPNLDTDQLDCIEAEIAGADTESLAIFLGAFLYEGPEAAELQQPFIDALDEACGLSS